MNKSPSHRFLDARNHERDEEPSTEITSEIREALLDGLEAYSKEGEKSDFSTEMAFYLFSALREHTEHSNQPLFEISRSRGNQGLSRDKKSCVEDAVRYIKASRLGRIEDKTPISTIIKAYTEEAPDAKLEQRTVERWLARKDMEKVEADEQLWLDRDKEKEKVDAHEKLLRHDVEGQGYMEAELIRDFMKYSARYYGRNFAK